MSVPGQVIDLIDRFDRNRDSCRAVSGGGDDWAKLARNLKAEIDEERIEAYRGTVSLPFEEGEYKRVAVKIMDDRDIESLELLELV